jgi:hypothetical protein
MTRNTPPKAIAFEWAASTYSSLLAERNEFREVLTRELPDLPPSLRERMSDTLGHEGDSSENSLAKKIWMLDGWERADVQVSNRDLVRAAKSVKLTNFRNWLLPRIPNYRDMQEEEIERAISSAYFNESRRLHELNDESTPADLQHSINTGRERFMFESLKTNLEEFRTVDGYGLVLVGAGHLLDVPNSLFNLCRSAGFPVERFWPHQQQ